MVQVKIFANPFIEELEKELNKWLSANSGIEVIRIKYIGAGGADSSWLSAMVIYKNTGKTLN